jgi:hypothetical protein
MNASAFENGRCAPRLWSDLLLSAPVGTLAWRLVNRVRVRVWKYVDVGVDVDAGTDIAFPRRALWI